MRLAEPEYCLLSHGRVLVGFCHLDEKRYAFRLWHLRQRENRALLHFRIGIILDGIGNRARDLLAVLLRKPEQRLSPHPRALVLMRDTQQFFLRLELLALREVKGQLGAELIVGIVAHEGDKFLQAGLAPHLRSPKRRLLSNGTRLAGRQKSGQCLIGGVVIGVRNSQNGAVGDSVATRFFRTVTDQRREKRHASGSARATKPIHRHAIGINRTIGAERPDLLHRATLAAQEDIKKRPRLQMCARCASPVSGKLPTVLSFERAATRRGHALGGAKAAHLLVGSDRWHSIRGPRSLLFARDAMNLCGQICRIAIYEICMLQLGRFSLTESGESTEQQDRNDCRFHRSLLIY